MIRLFDVREGESRGRLVGFTGLLFLIIAAHTTLETARDALLLTGPGPRALGLLYMAIAIGTVPGAALAAHLGERFGQRRALAATLIVAVVAPLWLFVLPASRASAMATYVMSGILGSLVVPQFWLLVGTVMTLAEARRLFGLISVGGTLGGVLGPALASVTLFFLPMKALLLVSAFVFALAGFALGFARITERVSEPEPARAIPFMASLRAVREQPFVMRVALLVFLSTATFLTLDYLFKSSVARSLPRAEVATFVAHYYLAFGAVSLVVQLLFTGAVVRRLGMVPALTLTPLLLFFGTGVAILGGGALPGVLVAKSIDGSLRHSLHRVTGELVYLPVPPALRQHAKPLIDGTLVRATQTLVGATLLLVGGTSVVGPRPLSWIVGGLALLWLVAAVTLRRPYLTLLRGAVTSGSLDVPESSDPIDKETAKLLVQRLASDEPFEVEGAMTALSRRGESGFIPALVLLHKDQGVLLQALEVFGESSRSDWFQLARRLLAHPEETVRVAAARALARHEQLDVASLIDDVGFRARGYAAVRMALRDTASEVVLQASVARMLDQAGEEGESARLGLLAAIADAPPTFRLSPLLRLLAREPATSREKTELLAAAVVRQRDLTTIPLLIGHLAVRDGREALRAALVALGEPALREVWRTLRDQGQPRRLRLHLPKTVARFSNSRAAKLLLEEIDRETDGLVRYKAIRALRLLAASLRISVDRRRTERLCFGELEKHFRCLALRHLLDVPPLALDSTHLLLRELLRQKGAHALERAFHLLQVAHPRQGVHHAFIAYRSDDAYARANGAELIDALLRHRDQGPLRALFRLATDALPLPERVERARPLVRMVKTYEEGVLALVSQRDAMLVALGERLRGAADRGAAPHAMPLKEGG